MVVVFAPRPLRRCPGHLSRPSTADPSPDLVTHELLTLRVSCVTRLLINIIFQSSGRLCTTGPLPMHKSYNNNSICQLSPRRSPRAAPEKLTRLMVIFHQCGCGCVIYAVLPSGHLWAGQINGPQQGYVRTHYRPSDEQRGLWIYDDTSLSRPHYWKAMRYWRGAFHNARYDKCWLSGIPHSESEPVGRYTWSVDLIGVNGCSFRVSCCSYDAFHCHLPHRYWCQWANTWFSKWANNSLSMWYRIWYTYLQNKWISFEELLNYY